MIKQKYKKKQTVEEFEKKDIITILISQEDYILTNNHFIAIKFY